MLNDREGPEIIPAHTITVPERTTCWGCKYYKEHMSCHRMMGPNDYIFYCTHDEAWEHPEMKGFGSREISRSSGFDNGDSTPSWCPFLRDKDEPSETSS